MFEIRYGDIKKILKLLCDAEILHDLLGLSAEFPIDGKGICGIHM
jgi:hypothetical protein